MKLSALSQALAEQGFANQIDGESDLNIISANTLDDAQQGEISFLSNSKYKAKLGTTKASVVIVSPEETVPEHLTVIRTANPYGALTAVIVLIHGYRVHPHWGIDTQCRIDATAKIGKNANIGPFVTISEQVVIGSNATIYPGCYIGANVTIGDDVILYSNVTVYDKSRLGHRVALHAGTVIGQDGLGYAKVNNSWQKIPQAGHVVVDDDVEMGANCAVDRATLGYTYIGKETKFSDLVVIGHGTKLGERCMIVAQVGIAGSVDVGNDVTLAGQVGVAGHIRIGDNVLVHAKSAVWGSIEENANYLGFPATDANKYRRQALLVQKLPELRQRLRRLEAEVQRLRKASE
jgi:UDP-3-O-[3-hydroxymyristoyl] glucosamine N-acyltransferase